MAKLPRLNARAIIAALQRLGFRTQRQSGSHVILKHDDSGLRAVVPFHTGKDLPAGTLSHILKEAQVEVEEFLNAL